jgi:hypothetical protein
MSVRSMATAEWPRAPDDAPAGAAVAEHHLAPLVQELLAVGITDSASATLQSRS